MTRIRTFKSIRDALNIFTPGSLNHLLSVDRTINPENTAVVANTHATSQPITYVSPHITTQPNLFYSPEIDQSQFTFSFYLPAIRIPALQCKEFMRVARKANCLFDIDKIRTIVNDVPVTYYPTNPALEHVDGRPTHKRILLSLPLEDSFIDPIIQNDTTTISNNTPTISSVSITDDVVTLPNTLLLNDELRTLVTSFTEDGAEVVLHRIVVGYEYFTAEQVLRTLLPTGMTIPSSFATVGHIAQLNLRDEQLPYKFVIGRVMLDKNPSLQTIVNKLGNINNIYRNFAAEILAGKPSLVTRLKEHNALFEFDFGEVYWNSRLQTEHGRIVQFVTELRKLRQNSSNTTTQVHNEANANGKSLKKTIKNNNQHHTMKSTQNSKKSLKNAGTILDLFAGVGPFAIPAGLLDCYVFGNDLNPQSSFYMHKNSVLNKVESNVLVFNVDARLMMKAIVRKQYEQLLLMKNNTKTEADLHKDTYVPWFEHIVMNLPATAQEFCDIYNNVYNVNSIDELIQYPELPMYFGTSTSTANTPNATLTLSNTELQTNYSNITFPTFDEVESSPSFVYPIVHCYCFARNINDLEGNAIQMCEEFLGYRLSICKENVQLDDMAADVLDSLSNEEILDKIFYKKHKKLEVESGTNSNNKATAASLTSLAPGYSSKSMKDAIEKYGVYVYNVRDVAPNKEMMCVSFRLRRDIVLGLNSSAKGKYTTTYQDVLNAKAKTTNPNATGDEMQDRKRQKTSE